MFKDVLLQTDNAMQQQKLLKEFFKYSQADNRELAA
jgi:hypothetical protein